MINFMRYRILYVTLSLLVLVPGLYTLFRFGLRPSIDFTGGTLVELRVGDSQDKTEEVRNVATSLALSVSSVQVTSDNTYIIRLKSLDSSSNQKFQEMLRAQYGEVQEVRFETVGPTLGQELLKKTFIASAIAIVGILLYIAWAFKNIRYGVSAIIALFHDVAVVVGIFALLGKIKGIEVDTLFVTAILTTMSFSVHDTIVVFDRIRELQRKTRGSFSETVNYALLQTMGRSLSNSLTIVFMLLALFLLGGETIRWFAFALLVGTISGTYSSPFVAVPVLYTWHRLRNKQT